MQKRLKNEVHLLIEEREIKIVNYIDSITIVIHVHVLFLDRVYDASTDFVFFHIPDPFPDPCSLTADKFTLFSETLIFRYL